MHARSTRQDRKPPVRGPLGRGLSRLYLGELERRNRRFDRGIGVERLPVPVISIGNLSVGGTGKTPMVRTSCRWLIEGGHRPCIAMRGYKGGPEGSDEEREYQDTIPDVPIVARPDRVVGVRELLEQNALIDCVVLDDGFQHRQIARDLDIVLLDASRDPFADWALPGGWLRELPAALERAQAVVITHAEQASRKAIDRMIDRVQQIKSEMLIAVASHVWTALRLLRAEGEPERLPVYWLDGQRAVIVCAIGNPSALIASAEKALGGPAAEVIVLRDHDDYESRVISRIARSVEKHDATCVVTTGKDEVKLARWMHEFGVPMAVPELEIVFAEEEDALRAAVLAAAAPNRVG